MVALEILVLYVKVRLLVGLWGLLSMVGNPICIRAMGVRFSPPPPFGQSLQMACQSNLFVNLDGIVTQWSE